MCGYEQTTERWDSRSSFTEDGDILLVSDDDERSVNEPVDEIYISMTVPCPKPPVPMGDPMDDTVGATVGATVGDPMGDPMDSPMDGQYFHSSHVIRRFFQ